MTVFRLTGDVDFFVSSDDFDAEREGPGELALRTLDLHGTISADVDADLVRDGDGLFADA
jgi:hypothetical protein